MGNRPVELSGSYVLDSVKDRRYGLHEKDCQSIKTKKPDYSGF
jgi:hypothetical protein